MRGSLTAGFAVALVCISAASSGTGNLYDDLFESSGRRHNVNPRLLKAIAIHESDLDPSAIGTAAEYGLMQILPSTARALGMPEDKALDPATNIDFGARVLRENIAVIRSSRRGLSGPALARLVIAAYNAGPTNALNGRYRQEYVAAVEERWRRLGGGDLWYAGTGNEMEPLAEMWLVDVFNRSSDEIPRTGDIVELTFEAILRPGEVREVVLVLTPDEGSYELVDKKGKRGGHSGLDSIRVGTSSRNGKRLFFRLRLKLAAKKPRRLLARLEFEVSGVPYRWPWYGIVDRSGYPTTAFFTDP